MPTITINPSGKTTEVPEGTSLADALKAVGELKDCQCDGSGPVDACHVYIQEGRKGVSRMSPEENGILDTIVGVGSKSRLACHVTVGSEPVTVELLGEFSGL